MTTHSGLTPIDSPLSASVSHASCMIDPRAASRISRSTCLASPSTRKRWPPRTVISVIEVMTARSGIRGGRRGPHRGGNPARGITRPQPTPRRRLAQYETSPAGAIRDVARGLPSWPGLPGATVLATGASVAREVLSGRRSESPSEQPHRAGPGRSRMSVHHPNGGLSVGIMLLADAVGSVRPSVISSTSSCRAGPS
jgi:hypothetical protein